MSQEHTPSVDDYPSCLDCGSRMQQFISYSSANPHRPYWICTAENVNLNLTVNIDGFPSTRKYPQGLRLDLTNYNYITTCANQGNPFCSGFSWADELFSEQLSIPPRIVVGERHEFKSHWSSEDETDDFWTDMLINEWENPSYDSEELFPDEHANLDPDHFV